MSDKPLKLENIEMSDFNPSLLENGQEVIFTLKDSNILDNGNNPGISLLKDNFQINEIKYEKDTGIAIEKLNENELLLPNKEKLEIELKDDGQIIDENILLNKFNTIKNKYQNRNPSNRRKFQDEFYNEEELKLLNKKKNRKKKNTLALFDIDINEEENKVDIDKEKENNKEIKKDKKILFSLEDKEKLENLFDKKDKNEIINKKNVINIKEELTDEENNNKEINNNINKTNQDNNYKIIDDYEIFLNNLPALKNTENLNQNKILTNNKEEENKERIIPKKDITENIISEKDEETTINNNEEEIPLITDEPIIGKGVCVALRIFKNKKMLKKEEEEFGRYHDKKYKNITNEHEEKKNIYDNNLMNIKDKDEYYKHKEINIEYRDENGKKLRPKEMARYQALIFHGEKSSVRKREKKLLREKYQVFVQNPNSNKTLNYMNFMKDKNNQAFATLQGKSTFL